jgi:hypothetical protein
MMEPDEIRCIRIDIVDGEFRIFFFVTMPEDPDDSDWWRRLREYLLSQPRQSRGRTLEGNAPMEETELVGNARQKLVELLASGPTDHKSLGRARRVFPVTDYPIVVTFFGEDQP